MIDLADRAALLDAAPFPATELEWRRVLSATETVVRKHLHLVVYDLQGLADTFLDDGFTEEEWRLLGSCNCGHCEVGDGICPMRVHAMIHARLEACVEMVAQTVSQKEGT